MKNLQFIGPFTGDGWRVLATSLTDVTYLQIGVEIPHSTPIQVDADFHIYIRINSTEYVINSNDILEFAELNMDSIRIEVKNNSNPYVIIDVAYETA